ncbi:hypothetical protein Taro_031414, partial [Colocasia esculenta]|nr:hypothetical protein [Colocasia esculenta]
MEKSEAGEASPRSPPPSDVGRDPEMVGGDGGAGEPPVPRKGPAEAAGAAKKGKSCKGYLYYSSQLKSQSRKPICVGITRTLQQGRPRSTVLRPLILAVSLVGVLAVDSFRAVSRFVPGYMVGESELEASKEGRNLSDFKYSCVGYSVFTDNKDDPSENGEKHAELPFCVGVE